MPGQASPPPNSVIPTPSSVIPGLDPGIHAVPHAPASTVEQARDAGSGAQVTYLPGEHESNNPEQVLDTPTPTPATHLQNRYRSGSPDSEIWSPVIDSLLQHRSVRAYLPDPLPPGTLETLVAAAQSAATSSNLQTWSVVAVHDPARKSRLARLANNQKHIEQAPLFLLWIADLSRAARLGAAHGRTMATTDYLETFLVAVIDAAIAAQNAIVAAESLGLGTVYIGAMRNHPQAVAAEIGLPPGAMAVFGLCVGHPDPAAPAAVKPRLPQAAILHHERYDPTQEPHHVAAYDTRLQAFQNEQSMKPQGWSDLVLGRMAAIESMSGRHTLRDALHALGFPLL